MEWAEAVGEWEPRGVALSEAGGWPGLTRPQAPGRPPPPSLRELGEDGRMVCSLPLPLGERGEWGEDERMFRGDPLSSLLKSLEWKAKEGLAVALRDRLVWWCRAEVEGEWRGTLMGSKLLLPLP